MTSSLSLMVTNWCVAEMRCVLLLLDFLVILHEHYFSITVHIIRSRVALTAHYLHLIIDLSISLGCTWELLSILGSFVDNWHVLQIVDV